MNKVRKVHRFRFFRIDVFIFVFIFIYLVFTICNYLNKSDIRFYEVVDGGLVTGSEHTGIILRTEVTYEAVDSGYINYYISQGKRAGVGTKIYSLDAHGDVKKYIDENILDDILIQSENARKIKRVLSEYIVGYSDSAFENVYEEKTTLDSTVSELLNQNGLENLDEILTANNISYTAVTSDETGVFSYAIDDFGDKAISDLKADDFDKANHPSTYIMSGEYVNMGDDIYRLVTSEDWQLVFVLTDHEKSTLANSSQLKIDFKDNDLELTGQFTIVTGADGTSLGVLSFDKFMVSFISQRYVDFNIVNESDSGLKIPISSVIEKSFYTIPKDYLARGGDDSGSGFYKELYVNGSISVEYIETEILYTSDTEVYIDSSETAQIKAGDILVKPNSQERYTVGSTGTLKGVYNINKGYAVFKVIEIIDENNEYYMIKKNSSYGLNVYDHILLDGTDANEGDTLYN